LPKSPAGKIPKRELKRRLIVGDGVPLVNNSESG